MGAVDETRTVRDTVAESDDGLIVPAAPAPRRTRQARVVWGSNVVTIGGDAPVRVQSMTNTDTVDAIGTAIQVKELALAGSELVRITVNTPEAAAAVPHIREQLDRMGIDVPLIGDFHYNGHRLLTDFPACAEALSKYRINPGNVGKGDKHDRQFAQMVEAAVRYDKPVRIGVNWGSLDQELLTELMDENARSADPQAPQQIMYRAILLSALGSARRAEEIGLAAEQIILSCKMSGVQDLISVYRALARRCDYPLHLGLTEAGMGTKGTVASTVGARGAAAGRHRRHDPRLAHAAAGRGAHAGGRGRARDPAVARAALVQPERHGVPRLRPDDEHDVPGARQADRRLPARADAGLEGALSRASRR